MMIRGATIIYIQPSAGLQIYIYMIPIYNTGGSIRYESTKSINRSRLQDCRIQHTCTGIYKLTSPAWWPLKGPADHSLYNPLRFSIMEIRSCIWVGVEFLVSDWKLICEAGMGLPDSPL